MVGELSCSLTQRFAYLIENGLRITLSRLLIAKREKSTEKVSGKALSEILIKQVKP